MGDLGCDDVHRSVLLAALDVGFKFKQSDSVYETRAAATEIRDRIVRSLPREGCTVERLLEQFVIDILPFCKNEASPRFLGFGDTGDDVAALAGEIISIFLQQNLINQSFDAPSATFVEIAVLRWLRELVGLSVGAVSEVSSVWDVGGIITHGGTASNAAAMMLAREQRRPGTMLRGVKDSNQFSVVVPRGIGHYSVRSSLGWIGVGAQIVEVDCVNYRYDLNSLRSTLRRCGDRVMAVVAYAGDSRTQTIDQLRAVNDIVRAQDSKIWLHADACWGFLCAFSENLRGRIDGIELYDSITVDAHKIMDVPYSLSALLVREPRMLRMISSYSDLIMQEEFAFGQVTPFVGSRGWLSLKLWMMMQARGISGLSQMAEDRVAKAEWFAQIVDEHPRFVLVNQPDLLAVAFMYVPGSINFQTGGLTPADLDRLNSLNVSIHARLLDEGVWHLHQFSVLDGRGVLRPGFVLHPLRLMANNDRTTRSHMIQVLEYVERLGRTMERASDG